MQTTQKMKKNEDDPKNKDGHINEDDLKMKTNLKMMMPPKIKTTQKGRCSKQ